MQDDFREHGAVVIERVRTERPQDYLKVIASLVPKQVEIQGDPIRELTDDELDWLIAMLEEDDSPGAITDSQDEDVGVVRLEPPKSARRRRSRDGAPSADEVTTWLSLERNDLTRSGRQ